MNLHPLARASLAALTLLASSAAPAQTRSSMTLPHGASAPHPLAGNGVISGLEQADGFWRYCAVSPILPKTCLDLLPVASLPGVVPILVTAADGATQLSLFYRDGDPAKPFSDSEMALVGLFNAMLADAQSRLTEATLRGDASSLQATAARPRSSRSKPPNGAAASATVEPDPRGGQRMQTEYSDPPPYTDQSGQPQPGTESGPGGATPDNGGASGGGSAVEPGSGSNDPPPPLLQKEVSLTCRLIGFVLHCALTPPVPGADPAQPPQPKPLDWCKLLPDTCTADPPPPFVPDVIKELCNSRFLAAAMHCLRERQQGHVDAGETSMCLADNNAELAACVSGMPLTSPALRPEQ
jgi:hypothetical protein